MHRLLFFRFRKQKKRHSAIQSSVKDVFFILVFINILNYANVCSYLIGNLTDAILVKTYSVDNVIVPNNDYKIIYINVPVITGYARTTWIVDIENASTDGKNMSMVFPYHYDISTGNDQMRVDVRNFGNADAKIKLSLRMTYTKTALFA